jgi:hypothetical protein
VTDAGLAKPIAAAKDAVDHAAAWVQEAMPKADRLEAGARRFAMTLGRALELALLSQHAQWCMDHGHGGRAAAAARRFTANGVDQIGDMAAEDTKLLA